ncbi:hypothetical protein KTE23_26245 [Burkholderia multivorans]|uniref:phage tail fiber protein n=1 Tax=Burkholderia multivorans TaxID=87883 RepID=UPI001C211C65|nr:hypothetical protein [Burkholderia multivorans]MBU9420071.1 hypothetical protein [Burkholderia multivorans]
MAALQKANLGTIPTGSGGDDQRTANTKFNSNVDVLSNQAALTTAGSISSSQSLTVNHIGKRISVNITGGGTITLPLASTCPADGVMLIRNVSGGVLSLAPASGSSDALSLTRLGPGESVLLDTDGVKSWRILMRGRPYTQDEAVGGNLTVGAKVTAADEIQSTGNNSFRMASGTIGTFWRKDSDHLYLMRTASGDPYGTWSTARPFAYNLTDDSVTIDGTGAGCKFGSRPTFAGNVAWDYGNLRPPAMFGAAGGDQGDLNPNAYEVRLSVNVVCGSGGSLMATSACSVNMPSGVSGGVDAVARLRLVSGATILADGPEDFTTLDSAFDSGLGSRGKLVNMLAVSGLTFGKTYTLQLLVRKMQTVGPLYPRYMQIVGVTA